MEIVRYRQFSKDDHEKIMEYLNLLFKENRYEDVIELDNNLIVVAYDEYDEYDEREKRVEFFPFSEEAKIAERLNEKGVEEVQIYRCTHGYLVIQFLELEDEEDDRKDKVMFILWALGVIGELVDDFFLDLCKKTVYWLFR